MRSSENQSISSSFGCECFGVHWKDKSIMENKVFEENTDFGLNQTDVKKIKIRLSRS